MCKGLCYCLDQVPSLCIPVLTDFTRVTSGQYTCKVRSKVSAYIVSDI